ncbi:MAG: hypothetical protein M9947_00325 [Thermomicrobiales bacterium]|nr:hypothetical protein [Thermomicrobiales bacterium]
MDTLTLVLVVIFIVSMIALAVLSKRQTESAEDLEGRHRDVTPARPESEREPEQTRRSAVSRPMPEPSPPKSPSPAWLSGVTMPVEPGSLSEAAALIESLLSARRGKDLNGVSALFTPAMQQQLSDQFGVPIANLDDRLASAVFAGDAPALRSVELVSSTGSTMSVRAAYTNGAPEVYRLVFHNGILKIDQIV